MKMKRITLTLLCAAGMLTAGAQRVGGSWKGRLDAGGASLAIVINISDGKCTMDSPDQGAYGIETEMRHLSADSLNIVIPAIGGSFDGGLHDGMLKGTFRQMGMAFPLDLTPTVVTRNRPQEPALPLPYSTEEVTFRNAAADATLAGTLSYPEGWDGTKRVPVVLMVTGSGQQNRDEEVCNHKPFLVIADYLARNGIATLRYDDRGAGKSTGDASRATTADFMDDAAAGIDYLKGTGRFGPVGVLGHSEGGTIAFMLAARGKADFIVSLAGTGVRGDSVFFEQTRRIVGNPALDMKTVTASAKAQDNPWLNHFLDFSPAADIAAIRCPVLALNGDKDIQVDAKMNLGAIGRLLSGNANATTKEYLGLNHLFQHCTTGAVGEYGEIEETISPEVLKDIAEWINGLNR